MNQNQQVSRNLEWGEAWGVDGELGSRSEVNQGTGWGVGDTWGVIQSSKSLRKQLFVPVSPIPQLPGPKSSPRYSGREWISQSAEEYVTALHESGHVIAHLLAGLPFRRVTIRPNPKEGTLGRVFVTRDKFNIRHRLSRPHRLVFGCRHQVECFTQLGGPTAEMIHTGTWNLVAGKSDFQVIAEEMSLCCCRPPDSGPKQTIADLSHSATREIQARWHAVEALANALMQRRTLHSSEATDIVTDHLARKEGQ